MKVKLRNQIWIQLSNKMKVKAILRTNIYLSFCIICVSLSRAQLQKVKFFTIISFWYLCKVFFNFHTHKFRCDLIVKKFNISGVWGLRRLNFEIPVRIFKYQWTSSTHPLFFFLFPYLLSSILFLDLFKKWKNLFFELKPESC